MNKIKNSFVGILFGFLFIIGGIIMLWLNEGNNVKNIKTVSELLDNYQDVSSENIDPNNEGKLIATNGQLDVFDEELVDEEFNVSMKTAKLYRKVEMYQWIEETKTDENDHTSYTYRKDWNEDLIDYQRFNSPSEHVNPLDLPYKSSTKTAFNVRVGQFNLSSDEINQLKADIELDLETDKEYKAGFKVNSYFITNSTDINNPQIGDIRISYYYNDDSEASILAVQKNNSFVSYNSKAGKKIDKVYAGILNGEEIINNIENSNNLLKWILRGVGTLLIIIAIALLFGPITTLANYIPILGNIINSSIFLFALLTGLSISLVVIAIAWIAFRPLLGIILLAVAIGLIILTNIIAKKKKTN